MKLSALTIREQVEQALAKYDASQPRDPKGTGTGGQWSSGKPGRSDPYKDQRAAMRVRLKGYQAENDAKYTWAAETKLPKMAKQLQGQGWGGIRIANAVTESQATEILTEVKRLTDVLAKYIPIKITADLRIEEYDWAAEYVPSTNTVVISSQSTNSIPHELVHALDTYLGGGGEEEMATNRLKEFPVVGKVMRAIKKTTAYTVWGRRLNSAYLKRPSEMLARALVQYIDKRTPFVRSNNDLEREGKQAGLIGEPEFTTLVEPQIDAFLQWIRDHK